MNNKEIIELYDLYGFSLEKELEDAVIFSYSNGYFNNIEIIYNNDKKINQYKKEYEEIGYSVSVIPRTNIEKVHNKLFTGFFNIKASKEKNKRSYNEYCKKQKEKLLGNEYEYINCDYLLNNGIDEVNVVDLLFEKLNTNGAQMIILEAAAGFGKTCTTYEVLKKFGESDIDKIPLLTELSKNRKASIFRYVLLSEIDRQFPTLSSSVVEHEIRAGNVPVIIDGFDELLSKSANIEKKDDEVFGEVQGMLDTIALLLDKNSNAKILITSRKSAIFTGEQFDEWIEGKDLASSITRIEIRPPKVKEWIGSEKVEVLSRKNIYSEYIANPILLAILRFNDVDYISRNSVSDIIDDYLSTLLNREKERQSLYLEKEEQLDIMYQIAGVFAIFNISSEDSAFVKDIILEITKDKIDEYISRYKSLYVENVELEPDEEEFAMKLVHHALLDRKGSEKNLIGFINDFFFGVFLGHALVNNYISDLNNLDYKFLDLMATAFSVYDMGIKDGVVLSISKLINNYTANQQLELCNKLFHENIISYDNEYFSDIFFGNGFCFSEKSTIKNCIFKNCVFDGCRINNKSFFECQFYNCKFFNTIVEPLDGDIQSNQLIFLGCEGYEPILTLFSTNEESSTENDKTNFERILLEQFWKVGSLNPEPRRAFTAIYRGVGNNNFDNINKALDNLLKQDIIRKRTYCYELNFEKLKEIRCILGRDNYGEYR